MSWRAKKTLGVHRDRVHSPTPARGTSTGRLKEHRLGERAIGSRPPRSPATSPQRDGRSTGRPSGSRSRAPQLAPVFESRRDLRYSSRCIFCCSGIDVVEYQRPQTGDVNPPGRLEFRTSRPLSSHPPRCPAASSALARLVPAQPTGLQLVDQAGHATGRQGRGVRQFRHPQSASRGLGEVHQRQVLVRIDSNRAASRRPTGEAMATTIRISARQRTSSACAKRINPMAMPPVRPSKGPGNACLTRLGF